MRVPQGAVLGPPVSNAFCQLPDCRFTFCKSVLQQICTYFMLCHLVNILIYLKSFAKYFNLWFTGPFLAIYMVLSFCNIYQTGTKHSYPLTYPINLNLHYEEADSNLTWSLQRTTQTSIARSLNIYNSAMNRGFGWYASLRCFPECLYNQVFRLS